jgi:hypothetical protein
MKYLLLFLISLSAYSYSNNPNRKEVDAATLEIQIEADKHNGVFVSEAVTDRTLELVTYEIQFVHSAGLSFLYKYLRNGRDIPAAVKWSHAIAKHRFAIDDDDDKLELFYALEAATIKDGYFEKTESLLDCKTSKLIVQDPESDFKIGFYPRVNINTTSFWKLVHSLEAGNKDIESFFATARQRAKDKKYEIVQGVLFAYTREGRKIQSCKITVPPQ